MKFADRSDPDDFTRIGQAAPAVTLAFPVSIRFSSGSLLFTINEPLVRSPCTRQSVRVEFSGTIRKRINEFLSVSPYETSTVNQLERTFCRSSPMSVVANTLYSTLPYSTLFFSSEIAGSVTSRNDLKNEEKITRHVRDSTVKFHLRRDLRIYRQG